MRLRICTWNVNSVRLRAEQAARFVAEQAPDVLCMQEIKCREGEFPVNAFRDMGLPHIRIAGQITLSFTDNPLQLAGWTVTDAQGRPTQVQLRGLQRTSGLDKSLFVLKDPRPKNPGRSKT